MRAVPRRSGGRPAALDELDLVAVGILHEGDHRGAALHGAGLARDRAARCLHGGARRRGVGHLAIEVPDAAQACDAVRAKGGKVTREAGPVKGGTTVIAFVEDPDGYKIEFIENRRT